MPSLILIAPVAFLLLTGGPNTASLPAASPVPLASASAAPQSAHEISADPIIQGPLPGDFMEDFTLQSTVGTKLALHDVKGSVLVVNFFATWCPPCQKETADFVKTAGALAASGVSFVGVDFKEKPDTVQSFMSARQMTTYPVLLDPDGAITDKMGVDAFPTTIVVGPDGIVRDLLTGELSESGLRNAILAASGQALPPGALQQLDSADQPPITTYTFDLSRTDAQSTVTGTFVVDIYSREFDYLAVRVIERWSDGRPESRAFGTIAPDGAMEFGTQALDSTGFGLLPLFAKNFPKGRNLGDAASWSQTAASRDLLLVSRYVVTPTAVRYPLHVETNAQPISTGMNPVLLAADVQYDSRRGIPVGGSVQANGITTTFSLRNH